MNCFKPQNSGRAIRCFLAGTTATLCLIASPAHAALLPFSTSAIDDYLLIGMTDGGKADAVAVSNGELGAHRAGAPHKDDFTSPSTTFPGTLLGNVPDIPLNAIPVAGLIDHSGNVAVTHSSGDFNFSNVGVYANVGVQTADTVASANDSGDNVFYYDTSFTDAPTDSTDGAGGFPNTLDSFALSNPVTNNNTTATGKTVAAGDVPSSFDLADGNGATGNVAFTALSAQIAAAKTAIPALTPGSLDGNGDAIHFARISLDGDAGETDGVIGSDLISKGFSTAGDINGVATSSNKTFTVTLEKTGLTVIDFDVKDGTKIEVNNYNFVVDGPAGSFALLRIPNDSEFATSQGNVLAGTGGIGHNSILFASLNTVEEQHFNFSNSVLNGAAFWSLTMKNGTIVHNNTQGCSQFIGDIINMNDVRFHRCFADAMEQQPLLGSLGDFVWEDLNGDGIQGAGEPGVDGVKVTLTGGGSDGMIGTGGDDTMDMQLTTGGGGYLFTDLEENQYKVTFSDLPLNSALTAQNLGPDTTDSDADTTTGMSGVTNLAAGATDLTLDAGIYYFAELGNFVWVDLDGDGIQDGGEPGVDGVKITVLGKGPDGILGTSDDFMDMMSTATDGSYLFDMLAPGDYRVTFSNLPAGFVLSSQDQGGDDAFDSDPDSNGQTIFISLASGESNLTLDGGIVRAPTSLTTPEPTALLLAVLGLAALIATRRRECR